MTTLSPLQAMNLDLLEQTSPATVSKLSVTKFAQ